LRIPLDGGLAWFKACAPVQAFEPRLTAELFERWSDRVAEVLDFDEDRGWLLLADRARRYVPSATRPSLGSLGVDQMCLIELASGRCGRAP